MKSGKRNSTNPPSLEQLLQRGDIWRGQSKHVAPHTALETGHEDLNDGLLQRGWPLASLVEICQTGALNGPGYPGGHTSAVSQGEWLLLAPALRQLADGYTVLLNPPALPFAAGLIQMGIDLDRLLVVTTETKTDFLVSFTELVRTDICVALLAWQPRPGLNYTELRKCQLACSNGKGVYFLFRPISVRQQSSPAAVRLRTQLHPTSMEIHIFKQKGSLNRADEKSIYLPLPEHWQPIAPHANLDRSIEKTAATILPLKRSQS